MKTRFKILSIGIIALLIAIGGCQDPMYIDELTDDAELISGTTNILVELTQDEINGILFMREEEKLAHDVYVFLYNKFGHNIFLNIYESEQEHMDAMLSLINFYDLEDSSTGVQGEFNNEDLSSLYDYLLSTVTNYKSAIEVGVLIEEEDIYDLEFYAGETLVKNLDQVYNNLLNGSIKHLNSFNSILEKLDQRNSK